MSANDWLRANKNRQEGYITLPEDDDDNNNTNTTHYVINQQQLNNIKNRKKTTKKIVLSAAVLVCLVFWTWSHFPHVRFGHGGNKVDFLNGRVVLWWDWDWSNQKKPANGGGKDGNGGDHGDVTNVFDVTAPLENLGQPVFVQTLMDHHEFANSYGKPFETSYTPPNKDFTHVRLSFKASTYGRQFDRLAHAYLGGSEIWRTSTAEPGNRKIEFSYVKDVSAYTSLFKKSDQDFVFVLNNVVDNNYTGPITASLTAEYYNVPSKDNDKSLSVNEFLKNSVRSADEIIALAPPNGLSWSSPSQDIKIELDQPLPRNTTRAIVDLFASGNGDEEFWYSHLRDPYSDYFPKGANEFGKHGPARFVEVYVNGELAGLAAPYPIIYTGGYSPPLWSKIVGTGAFDVPSYQVDLTPFLPYLWNEHSTSTIQLRISNGDRKSSRSSPDSISEDWIVSANLLLWQIPGVVGSGKIHPSKNHDSRAIITSPSYGKKLEQVLSYTYKILTNATLDFVTSNNNNEKVDVAWSQHVSYSNVQDVQNAGDKHDIVFSSSTKNGLILNNNSTVTSLASDHKSSCGLVLDLVFDQYEESFKISYVRGYSVRDHNGKVHSGQNGTSTFKFTGPRQVKGVGKIETNYTKTYPGSGGKYHRHVRADNGKITFDHDDCNEPGLYQIDDINGMEEEEFVQQFLQINGGPNIEF